jgi:hypothetical protein
MAVLMLRYCDLKCSFIRGMVRTCLDRNVLKPNPKSKIRFKYYRDRNKSNPQHLACGLSPCAQLNFDFALKFNSNILNLRSQIAALNRFDIGGACFETTDDYAPKLSRNCLLPASTNI